MLQIQSTYFSVHFQYAFLKYVAYLQSTYLKEKIRIGYKLKSAEVRTLVSRRYSENSSHTQSPLPMHTHVQPHTCVHFHYTQAHPCTVHTCAHSQTPMHTPHIPAHALNLMNHMKLYINRPNIKRREREKEEDRKKKEQESAEVISGLKS